MNCPWDSWPQSALGFCEADLCGWVKEPGNTWSNIGYVLIGFWIWKQANKLGIKGLWMLALASVLTGVGSAFFHASGTRWAGIADLLGMFLGTGALTALNTRRWLLVSWPICTVIFLAVSAALLAVTIFFPDGSRWVYGLSMPCCLIELRLYFRDGNRTRYREYLSSWIAVIIATLFWWLDIGRILCNPNNHILSGHAAWHLLSAAGFYFLFKFYAQFPSLKSEYTPAGAFII